MVLDVVEEGGGRFSLWGATQAGATVHIRVADFQPYFYMAAPRQQVKGGLGRGPRGQRMKVGGSEREVCPAHRMQILLPEQTPHGRRRAMRERGLRKKAAAPPPPPCPLLRRLPRHQEQAQRAQQARSRSIPLMSTAWGSCGRCSTALRRPTRGCSA